MSYTAERITVDGNSVVRLADPERRMEVKIAPGFGNNAYSFLVNGKEIMWSPVPSLSELKLRTPLMGNPLLAPWANRLDREGFFANGKYYRLNSALGNIRPDSNRNPIHGLLAFAPDWVVTEVHASNNEASVTSRLDFWRYPDRMAQFPFAHSLEMTYRLTQGRLEVLLRLENHSLEPMPVSVGFHPYFQLSDSKRDEWTLEAPVTDRVPLSRVLIPIGTREPATLKHPQPLAGIQLDDVFTGIQRDSQGDARFLLKGKQQQISVVFHEGYDVAVIYAPSGRDFVCIEPMSGPTNIFNLAHTQPAWTHPSIPPNGAWSARYTIIPENF